MKKVMTFILLFTLVFSISADTKGDPRLVVMHIYNSLSVDYTAETIGDITFDAFIKSRPTEILDETIEGSVFIQGGASNIMFNIGNLETAWAPGDTLVVNILDIVTGLTAGIVLELEDSTSPIYFGYPGFPGNIGDPIVINVDPGSSSINNVLPIYTELQQNYPNPFNPTTTIKFSSQEDGMVKLAIYNIAGKLVSTLVNENMKAGYKTVEFNSSNLSSGTYYYMLTASSKTIVKKMMLVK